MEDKIKENKKCECKYFNKITRKCMMCDKPFESKFTKPKTSDKWEKEFDRDYPSDNLEVWSVGIVAEALTHAKTEKFGADASHITRKLKKLVKQAISQRDKELSQYLQHKDSCDILVAIGECSCGLDDILYLIK